MFCVATPNPDSPSETYIRQHIRLIAPGNTAVLFFQGSGESLKNVPALRVPSELGATRLTGYFQSLVTTILYTYPGAISGHAAQIVEGFLISKNVKTILAEFGPTGCALLPLCRKLGIRLVVNFHGHDATVMPNRWVIRYAYQRLNKYADAFICGSKHFSEVLASLGFDREKIHVIPCGIEVDKFYPSVGRDPNLIMAIGRFVEKKAPHLTIQAFVKILDKCPNARLEMIGDGPLMNMCKEMIRKEGIEEKVILHGIRTHEFVKQKLSVASLFVQHSVVAENGDTESQGISLLEAMACEVPVVATRHNGFVETVEEGVTGFLVDEGDVEGMAKCMIQVLTDGQLRARMGKAARKRIVEHYESEQQTKRLRALLTRN